MLYYCRMQIEVVLLHCKTGTRLLRDINLYDILEYTYTISVAVACVLLWPKVRSCVHLQVYQGPCKCFMLCNAEHVHAYVHIV